MTSTNGSDAPTDDINRGIPPDEMALHALVSLPGHVLTGDRLDALLSLTNHFGGHDPSTADALHSDGEPGGDDHGRPKDGKRKRPGKAPRNPWGPFLRLKALEMPAVYEQHLQEHGTIAIRFINDRNSLTNHITRYDHETVGDAFLACYKYTLHLDARSTMDGVRWCFTMLMYFDLVKYIRPNGSARVGCLMLEDVKAFLGPILGQTTISPDIALKQLNEWSRCGYKLDLLCQHFGPGSLFFLESLLTRNFLINKFTASGRFHEQAIDHLRRLGLREKVIETKAEELGHNIRHMLSQPFRLASAGRPSGPSKGADSPTGLAP